MCGLALDRKLSFCIMAAVTKFALFAGSKVSYESYGEGDEALVFIHGWTCDSSLWFLQMPLYQKYRSILIDLPGHGKSDAPNIDYHHEMFSEAIEQVLLQEGISMAVMVGHSMGGPISEMLLRRAPELVKGIVFVDSFFRTPQHYLTIKERKDLAERLRGDQFATFFAGGWTENSTKEEQEMVTRVSMSTPEHVRISACTTNSIPHAYAGDEIYNIPALQIGVSPEPVDKLWHYHFPLLEVEVWSGLSHFLFLEQPERLNATVESFLERYRLLRV
jgi:pimeloyl-ACP methyl ester carboxylesterase